MKTILLSMLGVLLSIVVICCGFMIWSFYVDSKNYAELSDVSNGIVNNAVAYIESHQDKSNPISNSEIENQCYNAWIITKFWDIIKLKSPHIKGAPFIWYPGQCPTFQIYIKQP